MPLDGFLEIYDADGQIVEGECLDHKYGQSGKQAIAISGFELKTESADRKTKKGKTGEEEEVAKTKFSSQSSSKKPKGKPKFPIILKFTKEVDAASPALYRSYCTHSNGDEKDDKPFSIVRITLRKGSGEKPQPYLKVFLGQAFVTSYSVKTDENKLPTESISLVGESYRIEYRPQLWDGKGKWNPAEWDFTAPG